MDDAKERAHSLEEGMGHNDLVEIHHLLDRSVERQIGRPSTVTNFRQQVVEILQETPDSGDHRLWLWVERQGARKLESRGFGESCEPYREIIELGLSRDRNAMGIWELLRERHSCQTPIALRPWLNPSSIASRKGSHVLADGLRLPSATVGGRTCWSATESVVT